MFGRPKFDYKRWLVFRQAIFCRINKPSISTTGREGGWRSDRPRSPIHGPPRRGAKNSSPFDRRFMPPPFSNPTARPGFRPCTCPCPGRGGPQYLPQFDPFQSDFVRSDRTICFLDSSSNYAFITGHTCSSGLV